VIKIKSRLSSKDEKKVKILLKELVDFYGDFYITRNNIRYYIRENIELLFVCLKKGDKILFNDNGLVVVIGYAEKSNRYYIKLLAKDEKIADRLIKNINWNVSEELYCKIKENNPIKKVLLRNRWKYAGSRGKECLLKREAIELPKKLGEKLNDNCITN